MEVEPREQFPPGAVPAHPAAAQLPAGQDVGLKTLMVLGDAAISAS